MQMQMTAGCLSDDTGATILIGGVAYAYEYDISAGNYGTTDEQIGRFQFST